MSFIYVSPRKVPKTSWRIFSISAKKSFRSWNIQTFVIFLLLVQHFKILRGSWTVIIMTSRNFLHILQIVIAGLTLKTLFIIASNLPSWQIIKERKLLNIFLNIIVNPFYFFIIMLIKLRHFTGLSWVQ